MKARIVLVLWFQFYGVKVKYFDKNFSILLIWTYTRNFHWSGETQELNLFQSVHPIIKFSILELFFFLRLIVFHKDFLLCYLHHRTLNPLNICLSIILILQLFIKCNKNLVAKISSEISTFWYCYWCTQSNILRINDFKLNKMMD